MTERIGLHRKFAETTKGKVSWRGEEEGSRERVWTGSGEVFSIYTIGL